MNRLKHDQHNPMNGCWSTTASPDLGMVVVEETLTSHITPQIARIDVLQDRIDQLKSEIQCIQERCGSKIILAQILESLKD
jgi:hypothetical protein